jgi:hypothetical protein
MLQTKSGGVLEEPCNKEVRFYNQAFLLFSKPMLPQRIEFAGILYHVQNELITRRGWFSSMISKSIPV